MTGLVVVGCGKTEDAAPTTATVGAATSVGPVAASSGNPSISVDLPTGWQRVDPSSADFAAFAARTAASDPVIGGQLQQVAASGFADRLRFYAVDEVGDSTVGIASLAAFGPAGPTPLATIVDTFATQLGKAGAVAVTRSDVTVLGAPGTMLGYQLDYPGPTGSIRTQQAMFIFESDGEVKVASFSCLESATSCPMEGESIIRSARTP